jgi:hypothetical protein
MSALGQERTSRHASVMSALPPKADIRACDWNVRYGPKADIATSSHMSALPGESGPGVTLCYSGSLISRLYAATNPYAIHDNIAASGGGTYDRRARSWRCCAARSIDAFGTNYRVGVGRFDSHRCAECGERNRCEQNAAHCWLPG